MEGIRGTTSLTLPSLLHHSVAAVATQGSHSTLWRSVYSGLNKDTQYVCVLSWLSFPKQADIKHHDTSHKTTSLSHHIGIIKQKNNSHSATLDHDQTGALDCLGDVPRLSAVTVL